MCVNADVYWHRFFNTCPRFLYPRNICTILIAKLYGDTYIITHLGI